MKKTLLLVFVHGFKGGDDTFGRLPAQLRACLSQVLPKLDVVAAVYPKYETQGDLGDCVAKFREWLQNRVIDIEVANEMPSPIVDPSVHVVLLGHSMGGIIAAETLILLASEELIPPPTHLSFSAARQGSDDLTNSFMFPHIQCLLAFDTPFLGVAPSVVSYAAESHHKAAVTTYEVISDVANVFGWGAGKKSADSKPEAKSRSPPLALPSPGNKSPSPDAAATPSWQRWGRYAMFAGTAGAVAAGGAAALYSQRDRFTTGWSWVASHLEFVGCLARREELRHRVSLLSKLRKERGVGCVNLYTCLGKGAVNVPATFSSEMNAAAYSSSFSRPRSDIRTFCSLPEDVDLGLSDETKTPSATAYPINASEIAGMEWIEAINSQAADETKAHMGMFLPESNPEFYELAKTAGDFVLKWLDKGWYETSGRRSREQRKE